jgi:hypothetical protein
MRSRSRVGRAGEVRRESVNFSSQNFEELHLSHNLQPASPRAATHPDPATASADASDAFAVTMPPTTMDDSYDRKRYAHLDNKTMDNSYSHLRAAGASANQLPPPCARTPPRAPTK